MTEPQEKTVVQLLLLDLESERDAATSTEKGAEVEVELLGVETESLPGPTQLPKKEFGLTELLAGLRNRRWRPPMILPGGLARSLPGNGPDRASGALAG